MISTTTPFRSACSIWSNAEPVYGVSLDNGIWHGPNIGDFELVEAWASPDGKLRELDKKGLDAAVVSIAPKPLYFFELPLEPQSKVARETNVGLSEYCAVHPDRLRWMAHVPLGCQTLRPAS